MRLALGMRNLAISNSRKEKLYWRETEKLISLVILKYIWRGPISQGMCHVSVTGVWLTPISSRARRSKRDVGNGVSVQRGAIEMGREFWFHSKKLGLSHIRSIFRPQVSRKERAVVVISCSYCWKCPPSRVSAGVVDTPRLQPSLPAQIRGGNY